MNTVRWLMMLALPTLLYAQEEIAPAPVLSDAQVERAEAVLAELVQEDRWAEELAPPPADTGLDADDIRLLRAVEFHLLEAEGWLERGQMAPAGAAFLTCRALLKTVDEDGQQRLQHRIVPLEGRLLTVARGLLLQLPVADESDDQTGQDDGAADPSVTTPDPPAAATDAGDEPPPESE